MSPPTHTRPVRLLLFALWTCAITALLPACASEPDIRMRDMFDRGEYARVAARVSEDLATDRNDRDYLLDRMRVGIALLADGRPAAAEPIMSRTFEILRTQGINDDKTVAAAVLGEGGVIWWKGEPFEQAMMFHYISVQKALLGEWDNARAAASSSLFLLRDFGENERGGRKSAEDLAREAASRGKGFDDYLDRGYTPAPTDFALGHFMCGVANLAMNRYGGDPARLDEATDHFNRAATLRPDLRTVADALLAGAANTVFVVDFGPGPEKARYGPDDALVRFEPRLSSDARALEIVTYAPSSPQSPESGLAAQITDLNAMSRDHMWNNLEDIREAKSALGTAMMIGGAVAATSDDSAAQIVGLSLLGAGLLSKLTAGADTRYCELLPQRVYIAAARISEPVSTATLTIQGNPRLALPGLAPPQGQNPIALHYVRLPMSAELAQWGQSGRVLYSNDSCDCAVQGENLPYILGGRCVQKPTLEVLRRYQAAGHLLDFSVIDLENLYRAEGIDLSPDPRALVGARHILDGGDTMESPVAGSTGFVRLFCREHPAYQPRSQELIQLRESIRTPTAP